MLKIIKGNENSSFIRQNNTRVLYGNDLVAQWFQCNAKYAAASSALSRCVENSK